MSFTPGIPATGQKLGASRTQVLNNFATLRTGIEVNHVDINAAGAGKHKFVQLIDATSDLPSTSASEVAVFQKLVSGNPRLQLRQPSSGTQIQMSGVDPDTTGTEGYTFLPGGLLIQWGQSAIAGTTTRSITFPTTFTAATVPFTIQITGFRAGSDPGSSDVFVVTGTETNAGFDLRNNGGHSFGFYWMAIGLKA